MFRGKKKRKRKKELRTIIQWQWLFYHASDWNSQRFYYFFVCPYPALPSDRVYMISAGERIEVTSMNWTTQWCLFSELDLCPSAVSLHRESAGSQATPFPSRLCCHLSAWLHPFGKYTSRVMPCQYFTQPGSTSVTTLSTLSSLPQSLVCVLRAEETLVLLMCWTPEFAGGLQCPK